MESLTDEQIKKNAKKFFETGEKYGFMNDTLVDLLTPDIIGAPATIGKNFYNAFDGGLIKHILTLTKYAVAINEMLPDTKRVDKNTLVKVCFLHQIGKAKMFAEQTSQWHKDNRGEMFTFNDELLSMNAAERSVYYATTAGIELSEDEMFAIFNYREDFSTRPIEKLGERFAALLRAANITAIIEEK